MLDTSNKVFDISQLRFVWTFILIIVHYVKDAQEILVLFFTAYLPCQKIWSKSNKVKHKILTIQVYSLIKLDMPADPLQPHIAWFCLLKPDSAKTDTRSDCGIL